MSARGLTLLSILALAVAAVPALAEEPAVGLPMIHADFRTFFIYQNDTDFDSTAPLYDEYGQDVGYISTMLRPRVDWRPIEALELFYELEIGDNVWSRNDANQGDATGAGSPVFRHRQFWGRIAFPNTPLGLAAGYQHVVDPTALLLDRYLGAAALDGSWKSGSAALGAAQVPDETYEGQDPNQQFDPDDEGFDPSRNNFKNDHWVFYGKAGQTVVEGLQLSPGVYFDWDRTLLERARWHVDPLLNLALGLGETYNIELDLAGQFGRFENGGIDNRDVELSAFAAQLGLNADWQVVELRLGSLLLSADDGDSANLTDHAFDYSGKSKSPTVLLSEDWLQDRYDNLDERAAAQGAGLSLTDVQVTVPIRPAHLELFAIGGYGMVLEDQNLGGDSELGWEADAGARWMPCGALARLTLMGSLLLPGRAAAALSNEIDLEATETLWNVQGGLEIMF